MLELFANPAALTVGGAMVSSPILIHLINRMRFKRLRWAAMEFLLKSQKRNRRRLIIEQLLLLLLRCLLIVMIALLFSRFRGCETQADTKKQEIPNLHVVLLNDSLSMHDKVKGKDDCFTMAKKQVVETIAPAIGKSKTNDRLTVLQLSRVMYEGKTYQPETYDNLDDAARISKLEQDLKQMTCSKLSLPFAPGLARVKEIIKASGDDINVIVHIVSDFRKHRWIGPENSQLHGMMKDLARAEQVKMVYLIDTADPKRDPDKKSLLSCHDNLAVVEVRPNTRVATQDSTVQCTATVANFGIQSQDVIVELFHYETGDRIDEANYITPKQLTVPAGKTGQSTISFPIRAQVPPGADNIFYKVGVRLLNTAGLPLDTDGLGEDNVRFMVVEVRRQIPILIIDGRGEISRTDNGDSYYLSKALAAFQESQYAIEFGDKLAGGNGLAALESPELSKFTSILLLNVSKLTDKGMDPGSPAEIAQEKQRREILEHFVNNGGGVAFFMGPDVNAEYYNDKLWNKGRGLFPVPLEKTYKYNGQAPIGKKVVDDDLAGFTGRDVVLLRDDLYGSETVPIFGPLFRNTRARAYLKFLMVKRYWPTQPYAEWQAETSKVREVANLPNESDAKEYLNEIAAMTTKLSAAAREYKTYQKGLAYFGDELNATVKAKDKRSYDLASILELMLNYNGGDGKYSSLVEFWELGDKQVRDLKVAVEDLRRKLLYGSPLVLVRDFGQGRVAAFMVTAGKEWHKWADGWAAPVYPGLIYELQNYLSSTAGDSGKISGEALVLKVDGNRFPKDLHSAECSLFRTQSDSAKQKPDLRPLARDLVRSEKAHSPTPRKGEPVILEYTTANTLEPGYYQVLLKKLKAEEGAAAATQWTTVFNVDAVKEGDLERASTSDIHEAFIKEVMPKDNREGPVKISWWRPEEHSTALVNKTWDLSEWPYLFLIFLAVLVAEQALAVHLSFHLRTTEAELPGQVTQPQARAA